MCKYIEPSPLTVIEADRVAEDIELFCESDSAIGDSTNGFTGRRALIHSAVKFSGGFAVVKTLHSERRSDATLDRRLEWILPVTRVGDFVAKAGEQLNFFRRRMQRFDIGTEADIFRGKASRADDKFFRDENGAFFRKKSSDADPGESFTETGIKPKFSPSA